MAMLPRPPDQQKWAHPIDDLYLSPRGGSSTSPSSLVTVGGPSSRPPTRTHRRTQSATPTPPASPKTTLPSSRLRGVLRVARAAGLAPFRESPAESGALQLSKPWRTASALILSTSFAPLAFLVYRKLGRTDDAGQTSAVTQPTKLEPVKEVARVIGFINSAVMCPCLAAFIWWRQHALFLEIARSHAVREGSRTASLVPAACVIVSHAGTFTVITILCFLVPDITPVENVTDSTIGRSVNLLPLLIFSSLVTLCTYLLSCLKAHFASLNAELGALEPQQSLYSGQSTSRRIRDIRRKHKETVLTLEMLAKCFGPQIIAICVMDFWWLVTNCYFIISSDRPFSDFAMLCNTVKSVVWQVVFVLAADQVSSEGNLAISAIHHQNDPNIIPEQNVKEFNTFLEQLSQRPVKVKLGAILDFDAKLLIQAVATLTTYVVILLQFS